MTGRISSRRAAATGSFNRLLVFGLAVVVCAGGVWAGPAAAAGADTRLADAGQKPADDLARAAADRFAHAVDRADVATAAAECSLPLLNSNRDVAEDDAALKKN